MNPYISLYATTTTTTLAREKLKDYYNFYVVLLPLSLGILCMIYGRIFYVFGLWIHPAESLSTSLFCNTINMHFFNYRVSHRVSIRERKRHDGTLCLLIYRSQWCVSLVKVSFVNHLRAAWKRCWIFYRQASFNFCGNQDLQKISFQIYMHEVGSNLVQNKRQRAELRQKILI